MVGKEILKLYGAIFLTSMDGVVFLLPAPALITSLRGKL